MHLRSGGEKILLGDQFLIEDMSRLLIVAKIQVYILEDGSMVSLLIRDIMEWN